MLPHEEARSKYDELLDEIVELRIERETHEQRIDWIIKRTREMQPSLKRYFDENPERTAVEIKGHVVELKHDLRVSAKTDKSEGCEALKEAGLGQYVSETFNLNSISAYVRELASAVEPGNPVELPEPLARVFEVVETDEVRARKSTRGATNKRSATKSSASIPQNEEEILWNEEAINQLAGNQQQ